MYYDQITYEQTADYLFELVDNSTWDLIIATSNDKLYYTVPSKVNCNESEFVYIAQYCLEKSAFFINLTDTNSVGGLNE